MTPPGITVASALERARERGLERLDAQHLIAHALGRTRAWLAAHADAPIDPAAAAALLQAFDRSAAGEPLGYLLGTQAFHGLMLSVDARVLVPRSDTEVLVDWALALLRGELSDRAAPRVADLGTGSGAIALAVRAAHPAATVVATDASRAALDVARANGAALGLPVEWREGSWWDALAGLRFSVVLSNPPYIAVGDPHLPALRHEPALALTAGDDGLDAIRTIVAGAAAHLEPGGWLLLEHGPDQGDAVAALLRNAGLRRVELRHDRAGRARCSGAQH
jgi:release factor glutamine methyltransferase